MARILRPPSAAPEPELDEDGNVVEEVDPVQYGRIYVNVKEPVEEPEPEPQVEVVTEPAAPEGEVIEEEEQGDSEEDSPEPPPGNASRDDWAAYALSVGASEEDLVDEDGNDLGRDALREKYGTPAE